MAVARRGFLRLLGAAPIALPVAAREAASKVGVSTLGYGMPSGGLHRGPPTEIGGDNEWIKQWAADAFSLARRAERWEEIRSNPVGTLDPDLACSRSLSMSAAIRIQRERNFERSIAGEQRSARRRFKKAFGFDFPIPKGQGHE